MDGHLDYSDSLLAVRNKAVVSIHMVFEHTLSFHLDKFIY